MDTRVVHCRRATNTNQMIDHSTVEQHHQHKRSTVVHTKMNIVPEWIDTVLWSIGIDSTRRLVETGKQEKVNVKCEEHSDDADDDHQDSRGLSESSSMQATERQVSIETYEHPKPCRRLSDEVAGKANDLAWWNGVAKQSEAMHSREIVIEIPSVEHEGVEDGDDAQIVHGRLFLGVGEWRSRENEEGEKIERCADNDQDQRIVSNDDWLDGFIYWGRGCCWHDEEGLQDRWTIESKF